MNSRRLMGTLSPRITPYHITIGMPLCGAAKSTSGWQLWVKMRKSHSEHLLTAVPQKADIAQRGWHGRRVPGADIAHHVRAEPKWASIECVESVVHGTNGVRPECTLIGSTAARPLALFFYS